MICSITITSTRSEVIGDALRSVSDFVDLMLLVDLGMDEATLRVAAEVAGDRLRVVKSDISYPCSHWRNTGLDEACRLGASWAVMLDTDMRINASDVNVKSMLDICPVDYVSVWNINGLDRKEVFFRIPFKSRFIGHVHEMIEISPPVAIMPNLRYTELAKTPEQLYTRLVNNDLPGLLKQIRDDPTNLRWRYYLGQTYENLGEYSDAISAYRLCAGMDSRRESGACSLFRAAWCYYKLCMYAESLEHCGMAIGLDAKPAEYTFLAALCSMELGRKQDAECFARQCIAIGEYNGEFSSPKGVFRFPVAYWEGPFEVLAQIYCENESLKEHIEQAKTRRIAHERGAFG